MTTKEHKDYIEELRKYSSNLLKSENDVKKFFVDAGIHTETGRLTKVYSSSEPVNIGYKQDSKNTSKK
ncbi:hypothetical protein [Flavobacterium muglaense]|uniref:Uncharacterized protein n=1 Tax=Flavobacterium muglaense TaxID=2764716 RepID=A0A923MXI4_9FLAO|nr:hypothetical protein [Flavobacterium muglaense]MBC5836728.1 hypothetical protein [Flavobacterium muglaense]MBC5843322.1 hypothetical protein [Flavobacterium muglaense]